MTTSICRRSLDWDLREILSQSDDSWRRLISDLLNSISDWSGFEISSDLTSNASIGEGFCVDVFSDKSRDFITWKGILGADVIDDKLRISFIVFLYCSGELMTTNGDEVFAEYLLVPKSDDKTMWKFVGRFKDIHGEFEVFTE